MNFLIFRENEEHRNKEKQDNTKSRRGKRKNPEVRESEEQARKKSRLAKTTNFKKDYDQLLTAFQGRIKLAPSVICSCCGGLFYKTSTKEVTSEDLSSKGCDEAFINKILHVHQQKHKLCSTCKASVFVKPPKAPKIPRLCLANGFDFPEIPEELKVCNL